MSLSEKGKLKKTKGGFKTKRSVESDKKNQKSSKLFDKYVLKNALAHLCREKPQDDHCRTNEFNEMRTDNQIKLRCRQLTQVVQELRKTILRQDWEETAALLTILSHPGIKLYSSIIIKTCFILLFCHPKSNFQLLLDFIRCGTGYILDEDIHKFVKILFILRKNALKMCNNNKYDFMKVTHDPEFDEIK